MADPIFEQLVAEAQQAYAQAASAWTPDPGEYTCVLARMESGSAEDKTTKKPYFYVRPIWQIVGHPTLDGQSFKGDRYTSSSPTSIEMLKQRFIEVLVGTPSGNLAADLATISQLAGKAICIIRVSPNRKNPDYMNINIASVVSVEPVEEAA